MKDNNTECPECGRDMELIGFGPYGKTYECQKEDCGKGYKQYKQQIEINKKFDCFVENQKDIPIEFSQVLNDYFWDLV